MLEYQDTRVVRHRRLYHVLFPTHSFDTSIPRKVPDENLEHFLLLMAWYLVVYVYMYDISDKNSPWVFILTILSAVILAPFKVSTISPRGRHDISLFFFFLLFRYISLLSVLVSLCFFRFSLFS